jgi:hypothetical protein
MAMRVRAGTATMNTTAMNVSNKLVFFFMGLSLQGGVLTHPNLAVSG